ncbi:MAG: hypothetical protein EOO43_02720 [Flavobacterium sp.]|nr:MAG: hypothetical protein EOO43_02720 [Flavobacterium sp.]
MPKQPFTPAGVTALKIWLYELPPLEFNNEITAMQTDFESWSLNHLDLTNEQLDFYSQLSSVAQTNLAYNVTLGAMFKRPISLVQLFDGKKDQKGEDKLFKPKSSLTITSDGNGDDLVEGEVVIEVEYTAP